jgi:hypothetical protein
MIENTGQRDPLLHLLGAMSQGTSGYIEGMEKSGQQQLVNSALLPTKGSDDPEFLRLGFTFGEPVADDPMFRPATLPAGWRKAGTDHDMHSDILDTLGRKRVGVFYKAAFYDRRADMHLVSVGGYVMHLLWADEAPILDDEWATAEAVKKACHAEIAREEESLALWERPDVQARNKASYIADRLAEVRQNIAKAEALIALVSKSGAVSE